MEVNNVAVMRRRKDSWLNATQILKVAGIEKGKRTKVLEKEILIGEHEKVQGGYGKYQGTWIKFERGLEFCRQYGVEELLRPLLTYDMGQDGGIAGRGGIDTPTKEQAMAAQRKRLYNSGVDSRSSSQSGTFFKNISQTASTAVAAISKARFDSPVPRIRNGASGRPASFSRQSSQQHLSQENAFPGGSQQSMASFASENSFTVNGADSAYATQSGPHYSNDVQNGDFEEPPRKRMRPSPSVADSQQMDYDYGMSMREATPTEPNDSFVYHGHQDMDNGFLMPLPPLPLPTGTQDTLKKSLLMSLFTDPHQTDFSKHEAFLKLKLQELEMPVDNTAHTALSWAATLARVPLLKHFIAKGASIFRVNRAGETALMKACVVTNNLDMGTFPDILELLGPTIELRDARGRTVLHHIAITSAVKGRSQASKYYLESLLEFVVRQGSAPNSQQSFTSGPPALRSMGIGRFMSEIVNVQDKSGDTALNIAARIGNRSIISQLLEVGADPSISNRSNLCPIDFGIGDPADAENRATAGFLDGDKALSKEARESSGEIINCESVPENLRILLTFKAISTLLTETESEFTAEMDAKQAQIDTIHVKLRESSAILGQERSRLDSLKKETKEREERKMKIANLRRASEEERAKLAQMQKQYGRLNGEAEMRLGDADKGLAIPGGAVPANVLSSINPGSHQPQVLDPAQRQVLASLPPSHILQARLNAYKANNEALSEGVQGLKIKSSELASKYRKIISLCTGVAEEEVDNHLNNLLRSMESEPADLDLGRVREFLQRVDAV
jgi:ankyrin repeat protein